jgi:hypothetical protein
LTKLAGDALTEQQLLWGTRAEPALSASASQWQNSSR